MFASEETAGKKSEVNRFELVSCGQASLPSRYVGHTTVTQTFKLYSDFVQADTTHTELPPPLLPRIGKQHRRLGRTLAMRGHYLAKTYPPRTAQHPPPAAAVTGLAPALPTAAAEDDPKPSVP